MTISPEQLEQMDAYADLAQAVVEAGPVYGNTWAVHYASDIPKLISALRAVQNQLDACERGDANKSGG